MLLTSNQGATRRGQCYAPQPGQYTNSSSCAVTCPAGTFSSSGSASSCQTCGTNSVAPAGSKTCTTCGAGTAPDATKASCTPTSTYKATRRNEKVMRMCPKGFEACPIQGKKGVTGGYECIDTSSDLTSCGGCPGTIEAKDCSTFDSLAISTCVRGQCVHDCSRGFTMTSKGCKRTTNVHRLKNSRAMYQRIGSI